MMLFSIVCFLLAAVGMGHAAYEARCAAAGFKRLGMDDLAEHWRRQSWWLVTACVVIVLSAVAAEIYLWRR